MRARPRQACSGSSTADADETDGAEPSSKARSRLSPAEQLAGLGLERLGASLGEGVGEGEGEASRASGRSLSDETETAAEVR